jgi:beta-N-acetylhexosaminidase
VQQLQQIELAPFATVAHGSDLTAGGTTTALMTSHIRYRGFQGNIRELTPPISLAPQLQDLMALDEFASWRAAGGVLISDALGVPAIRRYYDPTLTRFPHRQVAQDAFLAGNDLLYLHRFALEDDWQDQVTAIKETILFFQDKYKSDAAFAARVDAAVDRILRMKVRLFGPTLEVPAEAEVWGAPSLVGQSTNLTRSVSRSSLTLIYPGREEFADRMPTAPLENERILIFTDSREIAECAECEAQPIIAPNALEQIILQLYGPEATGQVNPGNVRSLTFTDLDRLLSAPQGQTSDIETAITTSRWIIFAQLDVQPAQHPESLALRNFLARRSDSLRDKRLVVLGFRAPYYLDTTEISKLTAYFGVYGTTAPFLETAVRAVFREFSPVGAPPVTVSGINYELINQLEPSSGQVIALNPIGSGDVITGSIQVGSQIELETGVIRDRKGHPVPDGTLVEFYLRYPTESLALAPKVETTVGGKARTIVPLDRPGELWITAQSGEARNSTRIELRVGGDSPGTIATVVPTATPSPTPTPTITPSPTATATATPEPTPAPTPIPAAPPPPTPRVALPSYFAGLLGAVGAGGIAFRVRKRNGLKTAGVANADADGIVAALWAATSAWCAYLLYAVGWLPGSTDLQMRGYAWAAGLVTLLGGLLSLLWTMRRKETQTE